MPQCETALDKMRTCLDSERSAFELAFRAVRAYVDERAVELACRRNELALIHSLHEEIRSGFSIRRMRGRLPQYNRPDSTLPQPNIYWRNLVPNTPHLWTNTFRPSLPLLDVYLGFSNQSSLRIYHHHHHHHHEKRLGLSQYIARVAPHIHRWDTCVLSSRRSEFPHVVPYLQIGASRLKSWLSPSIISAAGVWSLLGTQALAPWPGIYSREARRGFTNLLYPGSSLLSILCFM
ncbi:hypothetical protein BOTBODRAFT_372084 [Botryobasidium botryosum FD-172 SS1]|uniref:Uncharacterized protein n=1 Tax=Botryobasidium botryosum (strain FD-172 SS1) TaxID=930990 RepID=A0A067MEY2_BOTB1|nr:hypothetical protein BOTBODRAFT_372084 [Botryobasidium botryosum FD-172 SS1]